jgi:hypothetical protein
LKQVGTLVVGLLFWKDVFFFNYFFSQTNEAVGDAGDRGSASDIAADEL